MLTEATIFDGSGGPVMLLCELCREENTLCASSSAFRVSVIFWAMDEFGLRMLPSMCGALPTPFWNLQYIKSCNVGLFEI
jgi:hypothetical protein